MNLHVYLQLPLKSMQITLSRAVLACLALGTLVGTQAWGQPPVPEPLSLAQAQSLALANNSRLRETRATVALAQADHTQTLGVFLPRITLSETAIYTNAPLNAFGFKLQQEDVAAEDFNPALLNDPGDVQNFLTQAEVQLPLINVNGWAYRHAAGQGRTAKLYELQYAEANVRYYVAEAYYGIQLVTSSRGVLTAAQNALRAALKYVADNVEAGYAQKADELAVRVRLSEVETELLRLNDQEAYYSDLLNLLLGTAAETRWTLTDSLAAMSPTVLPDSSFDLSQRADHKAYEQALMARTAAYKAAQAGILPNLNAFGQYGLYDRTPFGASGQNYLVGVQLKWDVFSGLTRKADVDRKAAERAVTQAAYDTHRDQTQAEWNQAWRNLSITSQELTRAELAESQAREAYRIRSDRYAQGLEKTFDLLSAESTLAAQSLRQRRARYAWFLAHEKLFLLGQPAILSSPLSK